MTPITPPPPPRPPSTPNATVAQPPATDHQLSCPHMGVFLTPAPHCTRRCSSQNGSESLVLAVCAASARWKNSVQAGRKVVVFFFFSLSHAFSCERKKGQRFSSCQFDMMHRQGQSEKTPQKKQQKVFTSRAFAKKDSVLNLCNPFVLLTHPPQLEQECLIHCGSVRSQISCIALADLFGVIS